MQGSTYRTNQSLRSDFIRLRNTGRRVPFFNDPAAVTPPADPAKAGDEAKGTENPPEAKVPAEPTKVKAEVTKTADGQKVVIDGVEYLIQSHVDKLVGDARVQARDAAKQEIQDEAKQAALKESGDYKKLYEELLDNHTKLKDELAERTLAEIRSRIGSKHGLSTELSERLRGTNEAEIEADAKIVAKAVGQPRKPVDTEGGAGNGKPGGDRNNAGPKLPPPAWKQPGEVSWNAKQ